MPVPPSDDTTLRAVDDRWQSGDCIDHPSQTLHRPPRGRPPLHHPSHPPPSAAAQGRREEEEPAPRRMRTWKRKDGDGGSGSGSTDLRKQQHLHRNRVAASKYRQKHKTWMDGLAERYREETEKRNQLQDLARSLKEQVLSLKEEAVCQSGCDCLIMKIYLERQAVQFLAPSSPGNPVSPSSPSSSSATASQESISPTTSLSGTSSSLDDQFFFSDFNFD